MAEGKANLTLSAVDQTKAAFDSVKANIESIQSAITRSAVSLVSWGAAIRVAGLALEKLDFRSVIDAGEQLSKLSERTGIAVESLAALQYAGKLANLTTDDLANGLKKLNVNIAAAARGEKEQLGAFEAMGISQKFLTDNINNTAKILDVVADKFSSYGDGANKVALANAIGGKSFEQWIPLLNGGSESFKKARVELEKLGGAISGDLAKKSQEFNDNLVRLGVASDALKVKLASGLIATFVDISTQLIERTKEVGLFRAELELLADPSLTSRLYKAITAAFGITEIGKAQAEVASLQGQISSLTESLAKNPNAFGSLKLKSMNADLETAKKKVEELGVAQFKASEKAGSDFSGPPIPKKGAPALPTNAGKEVSEYEKLLKVIEERGVLERQELSLGRDLTASEKFRIESTQKMTEQLAKLSPAEKERLDIARDRVAVDIEANDIAKFQQKLSDARAQSLAKENQELLRQNETQDDLNKKLADSIEEIGLSVDALDRLKLARLAVALATEKQLAAGDDEQGNHARRVQLLEKEIALTEDFSRKTKANASDGSAGFSRAVDQFRKDTEEIGVSIERLTTDSLRGIEDELTKLLTGQKTNFKSLVDSIFSELLRLQIIKPLIASLFGQGGGSLFGSVLGAISGAGTAGNVNTSVGYQNGSDLGFSMASAGKSSIGVGSATQSIVYSPTINVDSRSDRAAVAKDTAAIVAQSQKQFADQLRARGAL